MAILAEHSHTVGLLVILLLEKHEVLKKLNYNLIPCHR